MGVCSIGAPAPECPRRSLAARGEEMLPARAMMPLPPFLLSTEVALAAAAAAAAAATAVAAAAAVAAALVASPYALGREDAPMELAVDTIGAAREDPGRLPPFIRGRNSSAGAGSASGDVGRDGQELGSRAGSVITG